MSVIATGELTGELEIAGEHRYGCGPAVSLPLPLPSALSPSKMSAFKNCPLAFRFSSIDRLPEPSSAEALKGTLVHSALQRLFALQAGERDHTAAEQCLAEARQIMEEDPDYQQLHFDGAAASAFFDDAASLVQSYLAMEDPAAVTAIGVELKLDAEIDGVRIRGIIDRLDFVDRELVVIDYKTGRPPAPNRELQRLEGVQTYALLCEKVFGRLPSAVHLYYLRSRTIVSAVPSPSGTAGLARRAKGIWQAIERGCATGDFRPRPSPLCSWCTFKPICPAHSGAHSPAHSGALSGAHNGALS